jgi:hypothetical protein
MKLETEFRLHLQLRQWVGVQVAGEVRPSHNIAPEDFPPSTWVPLKHRPTPFSADEALLLCQCSHDRWLAWVPNYGEINLSIDEIGVAEYSEDCLE